MRTWANPFLASTLASLAFGVVAATEGEAVPVYTGEDLERMFGPVPAGPSEPIDKTRPEDWHWVEQFLDREYARIDAARQHDLKRRELDESARQFDDPDRFYGGSLLWSAGYPAAWWNTGGARCPGPLDRADRALDVALRHPHQRAMGVGARHPRATGVGARRGGSRSK